MKSKNNNEYKEKIKKNIKIKIILLKRNNWMNKGKEEL